MTCRMTLIGAARMKGNPLNAVGGSGRWCRRSVGRRPNAGIGLEPVPPEQDEFHNKEHIE
jgi:hypothetical protein